MTSHTGAMPIDLPCHVCGYDLRAHPHDGQCPECGASVAESVRAAATPRRPAWRDSDPRWRRRMIAGAWILVLLPLMDALQKFGWASSIPVPTVFDFRVTVRTLDQTLLCNMGVYQTVVFCTGVVLLFSKERGRRRGRLDWTRRCGVACSYAALLLSAAPVLFIGALVLAGIAAVFQSMPLKDQPQVTQLFVDVSSFYLRYGPRPANFAGVVLVAFSSIAILLASIRLFDALRSTGAKRSAAILLAPLALFSLMHLAQAVRYSLGFSGVTSENVSHYELYFWPVLLVSNLAALPSGLNVSSALLVEAAKWCIVLAIAVWLTIAQLAAWRQGKNAD